MTPAQKRLRELRERQSKERGRMAELAVLDELNDDQRSELDTIERGTPDLERQIRAAVKVCEGEETEQETRAAAEPDAERRERIELRQKASLCSYLRAALEGRQVDGAEAELRSAAGVSGIPLELWDVPQEAEQRQDSATGAPDTVGVNLDRIRPMVFANSIAPRLGIEMPRVASGTYTSATITTALTAGAQAKGADAEATAAEFTVTSVTPKRISARLSIQIEDIAAVGQANFESILRENLSLVLSDELDKQAINGDGQNNALTGIFQRLDDPAAPAAGVETFDRFIAAFAGGIDGLWATKMGEVALVCGPATYRLSATIFRDNDSDLGAVAAADYLEKFGGAWWTNKRMPDAVNNVQQAILYRRGRSMMMGSAGAMRTAVCPHWNEVSIDDIYSGSASGTRHFTMHVLLGDVIVVQADAYKQVAFRVAA